MDYPQISLKAARVNANFTQEQAAKELGINKATLQNYETGATSPTMGMVNKMSELYRFPKDYIFFGRNSA